MSIAIDFTASNIYPWNNNLLHCVGENGIFKGNPSQYQQAIRSIGNILSMSDSDKQYHVYGFGMNDAKNGKNGKNKNGKIVKWTVHHGMAVNEEDDDEEHDEDKIEVNGIHDVEKFYLKTIHTLCNYHRKYRLNGTSYCKDILKQSIKNVKKV